MVLCQIPTISPSNPGWGEWGVPLIGALEPRKFLLKAWMAILQNFAPAEIW